MIVRVNSYCFHVRIFMPSFYIQHIFSNTFPEAAAALKHGRDTKEAINQSMSPSCNFLSGEPKTCPHRCGPHCDIFTISDTLMEHAFVNHALFITKMLRNFRHIFSSLEFTIILGFQLFPRSFERTLIC